jgi:hypothetical protein
MGDVPKEDSGLASGIVNTAMEMGGSLGIAILTSVAAARTSTLLASGQAAPSALTSGFELAYLVAAGALVVAVVVSLVLIHPVSAAAEEITETEAKPEQVTSASPDGATRPASNEAN